MKYITNRTVTRKECHWLDKNIMKGVEVYKYKKHTYGCISMDGIAVTLEEGEGPFFELPGDSLDAHE